MGKAPKRYNIKEIVGKNYNRFWEFEGRFKVVKGSRASKKSKTTALWLIYNLLKHPKANILVVRKVYRTLKDSCYSELKWAIEQLGATDNFEYKSSPLEIIHKGTGQKILFRGLDDPLKITSATVERGYLCWCWIEEAYEIDKEKDFDMINESIRGKVSEGLFKQIIITLNPWSDKHWIKKRFFDKKNDQDTFAITTNYLCNEFLDEADKKVFERMKVENPKRYQTAALGKWGITDGLVFENWYEMDFNYKELIQDKDYELKIGLDFGYSKDPATLVAFLVNEKTKTIYVFDELFEIGLTNDRLADLIKRKGYAKDVIVGDSAEPKSIQELKDNGITRIVEASKGRDSVIFGIKKLQEYKIIIHKDCKGVIYEFGEYIWDKDQADTPVDKNNHSIDAMRYAMITKEKVKGVDTTRRILSY